MISQFTVPPELQQFLSGVPSIALANVVWDIVFPDDAPVLPTNPGAVRRVLIFDKGAYSEDATPTFEYDCYIENLDGSNIVPVTYPRGV